jgi:23S rRNA G2069 N7-methylase RlmK/C1962 C5-methylase RlmI
MEKKVLDVCCGPKGMWFDKHDPRALYLDRRNEIHKNTYASGYKETTIEPDIIGDFTDIKQPDNSFSLVVFDPPHIKRGDKNKGEIVLRYGKLNGEWREMLKQGFKECFRVLKPNGVLIFKWCEIEIPLKEILELTDEKPLFGHKTKKNLLTHWVCFIKS